MLADLTPRICAGALALCLAVPAEAAVLDLTRTNGDFADFSLDDNDASTDGIIVMTFSEVMTINGSQPSFVSPTGIKLGDTADTTEPGAVSFKISFNVDTTIDGYTIGANPGNNTQGQITITGPNGTSGNNPVDAIDSFVFDMGTIPYFIANEEYMVTRTLSPKVPIPLPLVVDLTSVEVSRFSAVPLPASSMFLLASLGVLMIGARIRRTS